MPQPQQKSSSTAGSPMGSLSDNANGQSPPFASEGKDLKQAEERRRQLNRRAQKAFRERRTEHMAHLEVAMEEMKKELQESQKAQSMAREELLMVKYKNSLLERILLENRIDVRRELANPRQVKSQRGYRSSVEQPHRAHKRRRVGEQTTREQGGRRKSSRMPKHGPTKPSEPIRATQHIESVGNDMMNFLSSHHPEPDTRSLNPVYNQRKYSELQNGYNPLRSLYNFDASLSTSLQTLPEEFEEDDFSHQTTSTASPESMRSPPDQAPFTYPDCGVSKVNKVAFTPFAEDLLMFEGSGGDPFGLGLDDIMQFPTHY